MCAWHDTQTTVNLKQSLKNSKTQTPKNNWKETKSFFYRQLRRLQGFQIIIDGFQFIISHTLIRVPWHGRIGNQLTHPEPVLKVIITPAKNTAAAVWGGVRRDKLCSILIKPVTAGHVLTYISPCHHIPLSVTAPAVAHGINKVAAILYRSIRRHQFGNIARRAGWFQ